MVIITTNPSPYLSEDSWARELGVRIIGSRAWGALMERRGIATSGLEVEFGITTPDWAKIHPIDPGTRKVVRDGMRILYDPDDLLERLMTAAMVEISPHEPYAHLWFEKKLDP